MVIATLRLGRAVVLPVVIAVLLTLLLSAPARWLQGHPGAVLVVAELNGRVVGLVTAHVFPMVHSTPPGGWLTALVVAEDARGKGVGQQLVARAEECVSARGAAKISLTSALHRKEAHAFYEALGYERSGVRLTKVFVTK